MNYKKSYSRKICKIWEINLSKIKLTMISRVARVKDLMNGSGVRIKADA